MKIVLAGQLFRGYSTLLLFIFLAITFSCNKTPEQTSNVSADHALETFKIVPGFQIELVASEPLIADPVAMEIDANGNMYVVEMRGNPFDKTGTGKVKLLTDTDGDGRLDKSFVFADSLIMPSGVTSWKKGVLVTDPPHVLYFEDSNGDHVADIRRVILTGFDSTDLESNVNNPVYGLDNWIYLGNGGNSEGDIYFADQPGGPRLPANASGHMVRFRPESGELETTSSRTQFGHSFDNWGHHFLVNNSNHIYQEVIAAPYVKRNPELLLSDATQSLSDHGEAAEVYPVTRSPEHQLLTDVGVFTSACSVTPYGGGLFPPLFDSVTFVAEPVSNLVHADVLKDAGASFRASRVYDEKEFLASTDAWFRPVNIYTGPDGALYVVDYYRQIIEGPEWMAEEVVKSGHLYNGSDKGRIYRISPAGTAPAEWPGKISLADATAQLLVDKLADPNIWWRRHAQRILVENKDPDIVPMLVMMAGNTRSAVGRAHALWTLDGIHRLSADVLSKALRDPAPGVRENAVKLSEKYIKSHPALLDALLLLKDDTSAKVRYQLLCTLGSFDTPQAAKVRQTLLFRDIKDPWVQVAALSALSSEKNVLLNEILAQFEDVDSSLVQRLSAMIAATDKHERVYQLVKTATTPVLNNQASWQIHVLNGVADGLKSRKSPLPSLRRLQTLGVNAFFENPSAAVRHSSLHLLQELGAPGEPDLSVALAKAEEKAIDVALPAEERADAIKLLALTNPAPYTSLLKRSIAPREPLPVQLAAVSALSAIPDATVSEYVLDQWPVLTPEVRDAALNTFLVYPFNVPRIRLLLDAIAKGRIQETSLGWARTVTLMRDIPDSLKNRARFLLTKENDQPQILIRQYQSALDLKADNKNGKEIFRKNCSVCHQVGGMDGTAFGPDLSTVRNWAARNLLVNILDPAVSIANGYDLWAVELKTEEVKQGIISSETPAAITLRNAAGRDEVINRNDVKSLKALNTSAMPPGLEKQINRQEMADLLAFLKHAQ
jgi:putative membrane-bound dehydrogenase-like protein